MTRKSGFSVTAPGGALEIASVGGYALKKGQEVLIMFHLPRVKAGEILGFGGWFATSAGVDSRLEGFEGKKVLEYPVLPNWGKFGSQWYSDGSVHPEITLRLTAKRSAKVALWDVMCGRIDHKHLLGAPPRLMGNMHSTAPEANFVDPKSQGRVTIDSTGVEVDEVAKIALKSCNRCARFLPVNLDNERIQLSFTNHCVATHVRPCRHSGFGRLTDVSSEEIIQLEYGFQLECRFCKKWEVNAPHNPQRSVAQMKEDSQRRRALEFLTERMYEGSAQLHFRHETGKELAEVIYERFDGRCFKCGTKLGSPWDMRLDHTRPLALLWPLDESATSLCVTCNSRKRDRAPVEFYTKDELKRLSKKTGIPLPELREPGPNMEAIQHLGANLDWFFNVFLNDPALIEERDGKVVRDLLIKALNKAMNKASGGPPFKLVAPKK